MRIAVYAGTFDPITRGHLSVIARASRMFDRLVVVVAENPSKEPLFSANERVSLIQDAAAAHGNVRCTATRSLIVNLAREIGADYLVRGLRGASDIEDEITLAHLNAQLAPEITTLFVPAEQRLSEVSSSRLKELVAAGEEVSAYCTAEVERRLAQRIQASSACSRARAS